MANEQEMPLFTRTFDFITWLLPVTNNFPRAHRHTATKRSTPHGGHSSSMTTLAAENYELPSTCALGKWEL